VSATNLGFGPVAPLVPAPPTGPRVKYQRLFDLPAIPSVLVRLEW